MYDETLHRHLILTRQREKRKYNLWLGKSLIKTFLVMAAMFLAAFATSMIAGVIT